MTLDTVFADLVLSSTDFQEAMPALYDTYRNQRNPYCSYIEFSNGHHEYSHYQTRDWPTELQRKANDGSIYQLIVKPNHKIAGVHQGISFDQTESTLPIDTYFSLYSSIFSTDYPDDDKNQLLIPGLRYIGNNYIIFEMPPTKKVIDYKEAYREEEASCDQEFFIPIPWQIYIAVFDPNTMRLLSVQMYFANTPLTSFEQTVYLPPILNFYSSGLLCRPFFETIEDIEKYPRNITGIFASAYDWVWNSGYNFDIVEPISEFICSANFNNFLNLIPDTEENKAIKYNLKRVTYPSNRLPTSCVSSFFRLWEQLDLYQVTNLEWISFSVDCDFFNGVDYESYDQELFQEFINDNDYTLVDDYDDDHDPDDGEYITSEDVLSHSNYRRLLHAKRISLNRNLLDALRVSERFMSSNRISTQAFENTSSFRTFIKNILSKIPCIV
jgi:hypothetical protein